MDAQRFQQLDRFFARAIAAPATERAGILAEAAAIDAEVGRELARLLAVDPASVVLGDLVAKAGASLVAAGDRQEPSPSPPAAADAPTPSTSPAGELIERLAGRAPNGARYQIEGEIGRGGMGAILRAFDPDLRRALAMKVALEQDAATDARQRQRLGRFLEEAQITGQLDHPGVVPVHELGLDAQGRLYFTMRLVSGRDLGAIYALARTGAEGWSTTRVLGVLLKVCETVAYAHSKGVIHRDLKPSNVMVGRFGEVYVMDWGVAKVLGREDAREPSVRLPALDGDPALQSVRSDEMLADPSTPLVTLDGTVLGTPAYMSPEQASGEADAMDVRSDVYALGAMLYHLFAGHAPYQENGRTLGPYRLRLEVLRTAPRPLAEIAPPTPPELVAIVERAMARSMAERYPTTAALADDLRAYAEGRVVGVYDTGSLAVLRKWIGRNKALSTSLAAAVLAVTIGAGAFAIKADQATQAAVLAGIARADAETSANLARRNEEAAKQREAEARAAEKRAETMVDLVQTALTGSDPGQGGTRQYLVSEAMDNALREMDKGALKDDPATKASLQTTIARILEGNGRADEAVDLAEQALATRQRLFPGDHRDVARSLNVLAHCLRSAGKPAEARASAEAALAMRQRLFANDHVDLVESYYDVASALHVAGLTAEALPMAEAGLAMAWRLNQRDHPDIALSLHAVAGCLRALGRHEEALQRSEAALEMRRRLYKDDHPKIATSINLHALCLSSMGRRDEAVAEYQAALAMRERLFESDHPDIVQSLFNLGTCLHAGGKNVEAAPYAERCNDMAARLFGPDHRQRKSAATLLQRVRAALPQRPR